MKQTPVQTAMKQFHVAGSVIQHGSVLLSGVKANVSCNRHGHVYVDGNKMNEACFERTWRSIIPRASRLIAIEASNTGGATEIYANFSNGFKTSTQWRCSTQLMEGWTTVEFEDITQGWGGATIVPPNDQISVEVDANGSLYCRGHIGKTANENVSNSGNHERHELALIRSSIIIIIITNSGQLFLHYSCNELRD